MLNLVGSIMPRLTILGSNYAGFSYGATTLQHNGLVWCADTYLGTAVGAYFVNMFPDRVGRVLIDGVVVCSFLLSS